MDDNELAKSREMADMDDNELTKSLEIVQLSEEITTYIEQVFSSKKKKLSEERRESLIRILKTYDDLVQQAGEFITPLLCETISLKSQLENWKDTRVDSRTGPLLKLDISEITKLLSSYDTLIIAIEKEQDLVKKNTKKVSKQFKLFAGISIGASLLVAGAVSGAIAIALPVAAVLSGVTVALATLAGGLTTNCAVKCKKSVKKLKKLYFGYSEQLDVLRPGKKILDVGLRQMELINSYVGINEGRELSDNEIQSALKYVVQLHKQCVKFEDVVTQQQSNPLVDFLKGMVERNSKKEIDSKRKLDKKQADQKDIQLKEERKRCKSPNWSRSSYQ